MSYPCERFYSDLTSSEKDVIKAIKKPEDINSFEIISEWHDDHEACVGFALNDVEMSAWWICRDFVRSLYRLDDGDDVKTKKIDTAKKHLIDFLQEKIEDDEEEQRWDKEHNTWMEFVEILNARDVESIEVADPRKVLLKNGDARIWFNPPKNPMWYYAHVGGWRTHVDLSISTKEIASVNGQMMIDVGNLNQRTYEPIKKSLKVWEALRVLRRSSKDKNAIKVVVRALKKQVASYRKDHYYKNVS